MYREKRGRVKLRQELASHATDAAPAEPHHAESLVIRELARAESESIFDDDDPDSSSSEPSSHATISSVVDVALGNTSPTTAAVPQPSFLS
jgi:hypothetical protein